jgi:hypothetical protein
MVPAVTATGDEKSSSCQPDDDSDVNVACAKSWPGEVHRLPMCTPVFSVDL